MGGPHATTDHVRPHVAHAATDDGPSLEEERWTVVAAAAAGGSLRSDRTGDDGTGVKTPRFISNM